MDLVLRDVTALLMRWQKYRDEILPARRGQVIKDGLIEAYWLHPITSSNGVMLTTFSAITHTTTGKTRVSHG
jgi:hypothetical protein